MAKVLLLTNSSGASAEVLPSLALLQHQVQILPLDASALINASDADCILIDCRKDISTAKGVTKLVEATVSSSSLILVATEGALSALTSEWGFDDVVLDSAGPAELEARIRINSEKRTSNLNSDSGREIKSGDISIDESTYIAKIKGKTLDLTFKEFELLKFFVQHPGRVFTRAQLLQEIWGYDYFGGTRTVDVHIRRLRAKLGPEFESIIDTVRNVGYKFNSANSLQDPAFAEK